MLGWNHSEWLIDIANTENLLNTFASFFAVYKYGHAKQPFGYKQSDAHDSSFIVARPASLMREGSSVGLARFITLCGSDSVSTLLALKWSAKIDGGYFAVQELRFLGYPLKIESFSETVYETVVTRAAMTPEISEKVVVHAPGFELGCLKATFHESIADLGWTVVD